MDINNLFFQVFNQLGLGSNRLVRVSESRLWGRLCIGVVTLLLLLKSVILLRN